MAPNFNKLLFAIVLLCISGSTYGQAESNRYKAASDKYTTHYNLSQYDSLFLMLSPEMRRTMTLEQAAVFFYKTKSQLGAITSKQFIKYESNNSATYKLVFENAVFTLNFVLDSTDQIAGFILKLPPVERNVTSLILPFHNTWKVFWGGDTKENNYHVSTPSQKNAFDFVVTDNDNKPYKTDGKTNDDYYAFGQRIIAPCDAEVVLVVDGVKDNTPGIVNPAFFTGNTVVLKTNANEFLCFAHLKQHSIRVKEGQRVGQGKLLGLCGNSGNTSQSHLHFHIQNISDINIAIGEKCYFSNILVNDKLETDFSPTKGDQVCNHK